MLTLCLSAMFSCSSSLSLPNLTQRGSIFPPIAFPSLFLQLCPVIMTICLSQKDTDEPPRPWFLQPVITCPGRATADRHLSPAERCCRMRPCCSGQHFFLLTFNSPSFPSKFRSLGVPSALHETVVHTRCLTVVCSGRTHSQGQQNYSLQIKEE